MRKAARCEKMRFTNVGRTVVRKAVQHFSPFFAKSGGNSAAKSATQPFASVFAFLFGPLFAPAVAPFRRKVACHCSGHVSPDLGLLIASRDRWLDASTRFSRTRRPREAVSLAHCSGAVRASRRQLKWATRRGDAARETAADGRRDGRLR